MFIITTIKPPAEPIKPWMLRIIQLDPVPLYHRVGHVLDRFKRIQSHLGTQDIWPSISGLCSCGCGVALTGRRTRWSQDQCSEWAVPVYQIIRGDSHVIGKFIEPYECRECHRGPDQIHQETLDQIRFRSGWAPLYLDHRVPVKLGGGASWLGNYQWLCGDCHRSKTNLDFGWKNK